MDIASAAIALLAPYLAKAGKSFASKVGEAAFEGTKALLAAIRGKFKADEDPYAEMTIERLEQLPEDSGRQAALASVVAEKAAQDPAFADEIKRLVEGATGGRPVGAFLTQVYGGEVGKIVNIQNAGIVNID